MAAMSATSSCDDRPDNGWAAPKIRRPRIGLGDDDMDRVEKHGRGVELGQELGLADILTTDFRWRCGSVEARMQRGPTCPPTAPISTAKGLRPTLSISDISHLVIHRLWTAHALGECVTPQPLAGGHTIAHLLLQSSPLEVLLRLRKGRWNAKLLEVAENSPLGDCEPPPPYDIAARDLPPPYTLHDNPVQRTLSPEPRLGGIDPFARTATASADSMTAPKPDWSAPADFRQRGKNKKKNQKKGGDQDNWGSGDEGKKDGGVDEKPNGDDAGDGAAGGAGAGAGAGGGGDDGDGGAGDGGGDDEWNTGKKKKKGKKGKAAVEDEEEKKLEEERKLKEQEEEDERKKKEEEEATAASGPPAWPGGGDADPGDEWGGFMKTEKKGKKGKKAKAEEEEKKKKEEEDEKKRREEEVADATPTANPLSWADEDQVNTGGGWGGFTTTEKKGKKGKKGNEEAEEKKKTEEGAAAMTNPFSWAEDAQVDADTAWATINTNDKKGKKAKKSKVRAEQSAPRNFTICF